MYVFRESQKVFTQHRLCSQSQIGAQHYFLKKYLFFHTDILTSTKLNYLQYSISMGKTNETIYIK